MSSAENITQSLRVEKKMTEKDCFALHFNIPSVLKNILTS